MAIVHQRSHVSYWSPAGSIEELACARKKGLSLFSYCKDPKQIVQMYMLGRRFIFHCKGPDQTVRVHIYKLIWNCVCQMFSWTSTYTSLAFIYCKEPYQTARMRMQTLIWNMFSSAPTQNSLLFIYCKDPDHNAWIRMHILI